MSSNGFSAFVSSTSGVLSPHRAAVADLMRLFGAHTVLSQETYPNGLEGGEDIEHAIVCSDVVVCLVGHRFGGERADGESWTQWELRKAIASIQAVPTRADGRRRHLLVYFYDGTEKETREEKAEAVESQAKFREEVRGLLKPKGKEKFYYRYPATDAKTPDGDQLLESLQASFEKTNGGLHEYSAGIWDVITSSYRKRYGKAWRTEVSEFDCVNSERDAAKFLIDAKPPLISDQAFEILEPEAGMQKYALHPQAFVAGMSSEEKAAEKNKGKWRAIDFEKIVSALGHGLGRDEFAGVERVEGQTGLRVFFVSAGGVGKSITLKRLQEAIHRSQPALAIWAKVSTFVEAKKAALDVVVDLLVNDFADRLTDSIVTEAGEASCQSRPSPGLFESRPGTKALAISLIKRRLLTEAALSNVVLLVDELDHVDNAYAWLPKELQQPLWNGFHVVVAGRPHALVGWVEGAVDRTKAVDMRLWRFIEPQEFTAAQSKAYLGGFPSKIYRYDLIKDELGELIQVPRILMYARELLEEELKKVRSPAEIYSKALVNIINRALEERPEALKMLSCLQGESTAQHVLCLLSALAFQTVFEDSRTLREKEPVFDLVSGRRTLMWQRLKRRYSPYDYSLDVFENNDMRVLGHISTIVGNGVLDGEGETIELTRVIWANRTVQQYLVAYWLARHAGEGIGGPEAAAQFPTLAVPDTEWLRCAIFYPHAETGTDITEDLNRFLAEMPAEIVRYCPQSWISSARAWYDPEARSQTTTLWSTEMIYRSWTMMHDLAGEPIDDWWDLSYQSLFDTNLASRWNKSPHLSRTKPRNREARQLAREALAPFKGHFSKLLAETSEAGDAARDLAEYDPRPGAKERSEISRWLDVPFGKYEMGTIDDDEHQGFPSKTLAHWNAVLDRLLEGKVPPSELATELTPLKWFSGAQGERSRVEDTKWLAEEIFAPHLATVKGGSDNEKASRDWILGKIRSYFRRRDEIPWENPQDVKSFTMHEVPVLNRWFFAFAPGHEAVVRETLRRNAGGDFSKLPWDTQDRPAIYISWFDAWAFAQWANWQDADGKKVSCRLPHEAEWEYACRWDTDGLGGLCEVATGQSYWWGNDFYHDLDSPEAEYPGDKRPWAHVYAEPGDTRPPGAANPNGLGFKDMLGNVWEWCANPYDFQKEAEIREVDESHYSRHFPAAGYRPRVAPVRAMRGGIWYYLDMLATCSNRFRLGPNDPDYKLGFRLVKEVRLP